MGTGFEGKQKGFQQNVISPRDCPGAGGGGRPLMTLRPRDFESDKEGTETIGRSCA
jgi:hypothetical protein